MSKSSAGKTFEEIKAAGNALYVKLQFKQARKVYSEALELNPSAPVILSNLSACEYELGRYASCIAEVDLALAQVGDDSRLRAKLLVRKAKCLFHLYRLEEVGECAKELLHLATEDESVRGFIDSSGVVDKYMAAAQLLEDDCKDSRCDKDMSAKLMDLLDALPRSRPLSGCFPLEFYSIGHEYARSLLACPEPTPPDERSRASHKFVDGERKRVWVPSLSNEERQRVNLFFGGVGDHRHPFLTLVDLQKQLREEKNSRTKPAVKCRMVLNDIHPAVFARMAVVFLALQDLGKYRWEDIVSGANQEGVRVATFLQYVYMFGVLPPFVSDMLHAYFDRILASESAPPLRGISMSQPEWARVLEVVADWRAEEKERWSLNASRATEIHIGHHDLPAEVRDQRRESNFLSQVIGLPDEVLRPRLRVMGLGDATPREARKIWREELMAMDNDTVDATLPLGEGALSEHRILREFKVLLLPRQLRGVGEDDAMATLRAAADAATPPTFTFCNYKSKPRAKTKKKKATRAKALSQQKGELCRLMSAFRRRVNDTWRSNVTLIFRPVLAYDEAMFSPGVQHVDMNSLLIDFFHQQCEEESREWRGDLIELPATPTGIFDWSSKFFCAVAGALKELVPGTARLEWRLGDAFDVLRAEARACGNGATGRPYEPSATAASVSATPGGSGGGPFMGVRLSNVPDYSGLLRTFIHTGPALGPYSAVASGSSPSTFRPFVGSEILLNNPSFDNYSQWVGRNLRVERKGLITKLLGFGYICGGVAANVNRWGSAGVMKGEGLVRREQLRVWLHTVFLYVVLPPCRSSHAAGEERLTSNMTLFLEVVCFLSHHRGYPSHWLASILEEMLTGSVLTSSSATPLVDLAAGARRTSEDVATLSGAAVVGSVHVDLRPFLLELRTLARLWMPVLGFPLAVPGLLAGPPASRGGVVKLTLSGMKPKSSGDLGHLSFLLGLPPPSNPTLAVVALVLQHPSKRIAMIGGKGMAGFTAGKNLRESVLWSHRPKANGGWGERAVDQGAHLITVVEWAQDKGEVSFRIGEKEFGVLRGAGYEAVLLRTDSWMVESAPALLSTAVVC